MLVNNNNFKDAFREAITYEFLDIPKVDNEISYVFSTKFDQKMKKLIEAQKKSYWIIINTVAKRIAIAFILLASLITTACSVEIIREPIVHFFTEVYEQFTYYFFKGDVSHVITNEYAISVIPHGFIQTEKIISDTSITTVYENNDGRIIEFTQTISDGTNFYLDSEHGETISMTLSNKKIDIYISKETHHAIWIQDTYMLDVICYGDFNIEDIKALILSIKK